MLLTRNMPLPTFQIPLTSIKVLTNKPGLKIIAALVKMIDETFCGNPASIINDK